MRNAIVRRCMALAIAIACVLAAPAAAWAHAQLLSTEPADSAVLAAPPPMVALHFNEPVSPLAISLIGPDGRAADLLDQVSGSDTIAIAMPANLATGSHVLSWRVVSTDGHPIAGAQVFSIGMASATHAPPAADSRVAPLLWFGKFALLTSLLFGLGSSAFAIVSAPSPRRQTLTASLLLAGLLAGPATLGLQGLDALGLSLAASFELRVWQAGLSTSYGATVLALMLVFLLAMVAWLLGQGRVVKPLVLPATILGALALALSGHASAADPQWLTRPAVFLHIAGLLFWVGALVPLIVLLRHPASAADRALAHFSRVIPVAVVAILASGATLTVIQLGPPGPQWLTPYGAILATKLALVAMLLGLALYNRLRLTTPALAGDARARRHLRRAIAVEIVLVLAILGLVAGWRFTPPPRALAISQPAAAPIFAHVMTDDVMATLELSSGQAGPLDIAINLMDANMAPLSARSVEVMLTQPALGIGPLQFAASGADSVWQLTGITLPLGGAWYLRLTIRLSAFDQRVLEGEIEIP